MNLGIIGKLGAGKTFAANHIIEKFEFQKISLAEPIKKIMKDYLGVCDKTDTRYRRLAQTIGTDWFRSEDPDVWINCMIKTTQENPNIKYVCDDVRFVNEAKKLLENNWILIYLKCPEEIRIERCKRRDGVFDPKTLSHPSETGVDDILKEFSYNIFTIDSSGSIDDMNKLLDDLIITLA